ncbi:MAG: hypothetical protein IJD28_03050 [Deferribacterales bacterium]|nr:hypothetical protein [Deferribacterales bacterium]
MNKLSLLFVVVLSVIINSCGSSEDNEWIIRNDWGYNSQYTGNAAQAAPETKGQTETIAKALIDAVNYALSIYNSAIRIIMPDIIMDNITSKNNVTDNGTCYPLKDNGTRAYTVYPISSKTFESSVTFTNYCVDNPLTFNNMTTINGNATLTSLAKDINTDNSTIESTITSDNLSINIVKSTSTTGADYILRGYAHTQGRYTALTPDNTTLAADLRQSDLIYRFDFRAETTPNFSKTIIFYYPAYGYVTADISGINDSVENGTAITMYYKSSGYNGGSCTFMPEEIGTKDFNCKSK